MAYFCAGSDIPGIGQGVDLTKGEENVWAATIGPIDPGAYRYNFNVDGVTVIDLMGGGQTLSIAVANLPEYAYIGVFGSDFAPLLFVDSVPAGAAPTQ